MPTLEDLSADIRKSDREYIDYVAALGRDQLAERIDFAFTDGAPGRMSREEMLMHVITHGIGHRGQVSAVMLLNSAPPAKDGFTTYLHEAEASTRGRTRVMPDALAQDSSRLTATAAPAKTPIRQQTPSFQ
jgi:uncharacterized damage-inducible protein DinB